MPIWDLQDASFVRDDQKHCPEAYDQYREGGDRFALRHEVRIHQLTAVTPQNPLVADLGRPHQPEIRQIILFYCVYCRTVMTLESLGGTDDEDSEDSA